MARQQHTRYLKTVIPALIAGMVILYLLVSPDKDPAGKFSKLKSKNKLQKPNIIFITLDTTRADHLPSYGYTEGNTPVMDAIAREGILFEQCISPTQLTLPSHCSMMTGLYPPYHGVRVNGNTALSDTHDTLAELFSKQGYQCGAFIAAFVLDGRWGLKQGFHHYDDQFDLSKYKQLDLGAVQRPAGEVFDSALAWLDTKKSAPFFAWIHLYDPHSPYDPPEPYRSQYKDRGRHGLYDGEIAYTDSQIGRCVEWLKDNRLDRNTFVVIMGDHGEGLGEHGEMTHGFYIYDYAIHVPLLIRTPFKELSGIRIPSQVRLTDVYPTLLDMLGMEIPAENQGESLLPLIFDPTAPDTRMAYSEAMAPNVQYGWSTLHSWRSTGYKYIEAPRPELYDLSKDPLEEENIRLRYRKIAETYKEDLARFMEDSSKGAPEQEAANLDSDTLQRLANLGYVGAPVSRKTGKSLADPKDKLDVFNKISLSVEYSNRENYDKAAELLQEVLKMDPRNPQARLQLASAYIKTKRPEAAKVLLDQVLKDDPNNVKALITLANVLSAEENYTDVIALCHKIIAVDSSNTQAYSLIGDAYMSQEDPAKALTYLEKAVEIQPKLTRNRQNLAACLVGLKQYRRAESLLTDIIRKNPKFPLAHFHLGLLYEELGQHEDAIKTYREEFTLYESFIPARFNYGKLLFRTGDRQGYIREMKKIIEIDPEYARGYLFLARGLLHENADPDDILGLVEKGLALAEESELKALGYFLLADIYNRKNDSARVKDSLEKANFYKNQ